MKTLIRLITLMIITTLMFSACKKNEKDNSLLILLGLSGGGGTPSATFTKQFVPTPTNLNSYPFNNILDTKTQYLYTAAEIGASGMITRIRLQQANVLASEVTCPNMTVKMSHTNLTALTTTWANNVATGQGAEQTLLNNKTLTIPAAAAGTWIDIPLDTPFNYNGVDNLVVDIERTTKCSASVNTNIVDSTARRAYSSGTDTVAGTPQYDVATAGVDTRQPLMQFVFSGGDNSIRYTDTGALGNVNPWPLTSSPVKVQLLYSASEINGSGFITGIGFPVGTNPRGNTTASQTYTINIKLGHTSLSGLTTTFANNFDVATPVTVAASAPLTVPAGLPDGTYIWLPLPDGMFYYNGTNNLIVEIQTPLGTGDTQWIKDNSGTAARLTAADIALSTGSTDSYHYFIKFRFNGGTIDVVTDDTNQTMAFDTVANGRLNLYRATELGTAGTIRSIYCRLGDTVSTAANYANYQVIIGHSDLNSLSVTSADNFVAQTTAVNGTVSVPAGLVKGDWIEIPLSTPFAYDGKKNLAVWLGTTAASGAVLTHGGLISSSDAVRYAGQIAAGAPGDATVAAPLNYKFDMKFKISK